MPLTLFPTFALSPDGLGFVPAITVARADGSLIQTYRPSGPSAEFRTFTNHKAASADAWVIARRVVAARPEHFCQL